MPEPSGKAGPGCADRRMYQRGSCIQHYQPVSHVSHGLFTDRTHEAFYGSPFHGKRTEVFTEAFKKPLLTEEEYQLLSYLQREGDVSCHLKCLKEEAKSREPNLADSRQEQIQREFISRVAQLYYKKQLVIDNIRRED